MPNSMYYGITIGPIYATIMRTSTPGGLWFASTMFSEVSKHLCSALVEAKVKKENIYSPYYSAGNDVVSPEGVGLYHDRILFTAQAGFEKQLTNIIKNTKVQFAQYFKNTFPQREEELSSFMEQFLQISFACVPQNSTQNIVKALSPSLDALELQSGYLHKISDWPIAQMLDATNGSEENISPNENIKNSFLMYKNPSFPCKEENKIKPQILKKDKSDNLKSTLNISSMDDTYTDDEAVTVSLPIEKHRRYLAIVKADGDKMGKTLLGLQNNEEVRAFSKACLKYAAKASKVIGEYKGVTIYAGGDDLVFLAPVQEILPLCKELSGLYHEILDPLMKGKPEKTALSFGIQLCNYRYPLYEALQQAENLLYEMKEKGGNGINLCLQKESGRKICFWVKHKTSSMNTLLELQDKINENIEKKEPFIWLQSVIYTVQQHKQLFIQALQKKIEIRQLFNNLFHQDIHQQPEIKEFLQLAAGLMEDIWREEQKKLDNKADEQTHERAYGLYNAMLRYVGFFLESGGEE